MSAPAGTGKTTLGEKLTEEFSCVKRSVTTTTRSPRSGENPGEHYNFLTPHEFEEKIENGDFLEHVKLYDNYYGTSKSEIFSQIEKGFHVMLIIDTQGALQLMKDELTV